MSLHRYAFLIKAPGYQADQHRQQLVSPLFHTTIVGVSDVTQAIVEATKLCKQGVQLLELCGGFDNDEVNQVIAALPADFPVGHVQFSPAQQVRLQALLGQKA